MCAEGHAGGEGDVAAERRTPHPGAHLPDHGLARVLGQGLAHALGAPDKDSWNLEPWRPDVGLLATLTARCNPD